MKSFHSQSARYGRKDGQALVLFLFFSVVLILFVGLGIDLGFAYVTKAQLSKALDASSLAAISNYSGADKGDAAKAIALNTFLANYGSNGFSGRATGGLPVHNVGTFVPQANGNLVFTNTASAQINTYFIGLLPQWKTLTVADTAVAVRAPVVMTLVLDRSGSMTPGVLPANCQPQSDGGTWLPAAVTSFLNIFDETLDRAALVTFASSSSNDVVMGAVGTKFKTSINAAMTRINKPGNRLWAGGTCTIAGLTNALRIQNGAGAPPNAVNVVVLFTDGQANMTTGVFGGKPMNFGGRDPIQAGCTGVSPGAGFYPTNAPETVAGQNTTLCNAPSCNNIAPACNPGSTVPITWTDVNGASHFFCALNITEDATNRCVRIADQMRTSNASNYVFAVGLSASVASPTLDMLQQVANDPDSATFNPKLPVGAAFVSSGNDLASVFQQVAADIILRLVQ